MHDQYSTKVLIFLASICTLFFVNKCRAECPDIGVTASLGYVLHPDFGDDVAVLAGLADKALYEAKHHGKNTAVEYKERIG